MIGLSQSRKAFGLGKAALLAGLTVAAVVGSGMNRAANAQNVIYGFTTLNRLFSFSSNTPGTTTPYVTITGVAGSLLDIDFRPSNGLLYGLGNNAGTLSTYTISTTTGVATLLGTYTNVTAGADDYDIDFNPAADALRIIGSNGDNYRVPNAGGTFASLIVDGSVMGVSNPNILGTAYTNSSAGIAASTTQYYIGNNGQLYTTTTPNAPTITTIGGANAALSATTIAFDIAGANTAYVVANNTLYLENLTAGTSTSLGAIATPGGTVRGISATIQPAAAPEPGSLVLLGTGLVSMGGIAVRRKAKKA